MTKMGLSGGGLMPAGREPGPANHEASGQNFLIKWLLCNVEVHARAKFASQFWFAAFNL